MAKLYGFEELPVWQKAEYFGELLQGSHTTSERQILTGIMLPLGLLVHQVLSNSEEVMCELLLNWYGITHT